VEDGVAVEGTWYHVKNLPVVGWQYEETHLGNVQSTVNLLARFLIAKIEDEELLIAIFRNVRVVQNDPNWRCRTWVAHVLRDLARDGKAVGTSELS
jgi:hypothetical protein